MKKSILHNLSSQTTNGNKKVRNAKSHEYDGIKFRSGLEVYCYKVLVTNGIDVAYEPKRIVISESFECGYESYESSSSGKDAILSPASKKIRQMTYNPDFMDKNGDTFGEEFIIECKGYSNDAFPNKLKLIKKHLTNIGYKGTYYMPRTQKQVRQTIELILQKRKDHGRHCGKQLAIWPGNLPRV